MTPKLHGDFLHRKRRRLGTVLMSTMSFGIATHAMAQSAQTAPAQATQPASAQQAASVGGPNGAENPSTVDINEFIVRGNSMLKPIDIEKAVYPFEGPGRTMKDVLAAADALTRVYQDKGYQAVTVSVPDQHVANGVIYLQVDEVSIGRVRVEGAKYSSPQEIRDAVPALAEGKVADFTLAQQQLGDLNKSADRQVTPTLAPGAMPQTVDVTLHVDDHSPWHGSLELNNDQSPDTSVLRTVAALSYSNLWQMGHTLSGSFLIAPQHPRDAEVYTGAYSAPIPDSNWVLQASLLHSNSNVAAIGGTSVLGKGTSVGFNASYALPATETYSQTASVQLDYKHFQESDSIVGQPTTQAPVTYVPVTLAYNGALNYEHDRTTFGTSLMINIPGVGSSVQDFDNKRFNATADFVIAKFDASFLHLFNQDYQLSARASAQLANEPVVSSEEFAAGGINTVRGYLEAEETADNGVIGSVEFRSPSISKYVNSNLNEWRFHAFVDGAHLWLLSPLPEQISSYNMVSVGLGSRMQLFKYASADLEMAFPLKAGTYTRAYNPRFDFYIRASF
ncbi:Hemolysin activation/secretion protein [Pararobbsia alpina]|uniref:ShlB/FhaC/HecB family hemolysin secretion/activation protein n=1 Tax=Pararobbsia alpina TaxID=621374 RepID=UPI0039A4EB25